jgi:hypothetical protein
MADTTHSRSAILAPALGHPAPIPLLVDIRATQSSQLFPKSCGTMQPLARNFAQTNGYALRNVSTPNRESRRMRSSNNCVVQTSQSIPNGPEIVQPHATCFAGRTPSAILDDRESLRVRRSNRRGIRTSASESTAKHTALCRP